MAPLRVLLLSTELGALGLVAWLVGVVAPWIDRAQSVVWLGFWFVGVVLLCFALFCYAYGSHHREFRADALAVKLLGDRTPVLMMLEECLGGHEQLGRMARICGLLTHPSPTRRQHKLLGTSSENP